ncbi:proteasome-activating nucleotidase [Halovivax asiaticus JCM 14624]|uniref:Proteasome-activating nucleotidase n=1 Tax=Halovivax asiaticus JCM 14624 TaxID=1227490 RepID=M0BL82_9EURY|nr:proteasome-activating nucleotidase [Halovivax asiaticus]ELZ11048.1 proteasome-activating nucleotidase [Halovivax asiaticus JCM 14624]
MARSPSLPDRPTRDIDPNLPDEERLDALRSHLEELTDVQEKLASQLESAEERRDELRERVDQVERENECLKHSPLYVASVEESFDGEVVVKQHGNNQEVLTEVSPRMADRIEPGDRVAVDDSFGLQTLLSAETDARAQAMEITEKPDVSYDDIGGIDDQVREVREAVEQPLAEPELFEQVGIEPPSGVLLYGPPGTGKTMLAKAVATKTDATFIKMAGSELVRKFIGEGSRLVRDLFELAREREPAIIFIDEIDAVAATRTDSKTSGDAEVQRTMMQLLNEMDGFEHRGEISIIAATNRFDMLDRAILRPGRFDRLIEVPEPDVGGRERIFEIHSQDLSLADAVDYDVLAERTDGYSGAEIESVTTEAGMFAIRDDRTAVTMADFEDAIDKLESDDGSEYVSSENYFFN